jgi:hypothetical protein
MNGRDALMTNRINIVLVAAAACAFAPTPLSAEIPQTPSGDTDMRALCAEPSTPMYPSRAQERGREGKVVLSFSVEDGRLSACAVVSEDPVGWGFGASALTLACHFKLDSEPAERIEVPLTFRLKSADEPSG